MQPIYIRMKRSIFKYILTSLLIVAALGLFLRSCTSASTSKPTITVSIQPQKYMLEKIVGDKWEIKCLLSNGANPESYDPSLTHLLNLENSKAYFRIGNVAFESAIINKVQNNNPGLKLFDNSEGISLIRGTHSHGDVEHASDIDPHTWTSVKNAKTIASNMYKAVVDLDPENKAYYSRNFKNFLSSLDSLDREISQQLQPYRGSVFVVWHPSLSYFARDYGLEQISLSPEGKEASVKMMQSTIDKAIDRDVKTLFFQKDIDSRQAQVANEQIKAEIVNINPLNYEWDKEMRSIANAISRQ